MPFYLVWTCICARAYARVISNLTAFSCMCQPFDKAFPSMPTPTVVVSNVPHGRYLVLPYQGYLRDIISNLAAFAPAARFCLIGGEGCTQEKGPDNIGEILDTLGFEQISTVKCRKLYLTFALGPCHVDNKRQMKWAASEA